jgi:hypothetical protein
MRRDVDLNKYGSPRVILLEEIPETRREKFTLDYIKDKVREFRKGGHPSRVYDSVTPNIYWFRIVGARFVRVQAYGFGLLLRLYNPK